MGKSLLTRIVKIGNSQGVRIPRVLLEQTGLPEEVELVVEGDRLVIQPAQGPRQGWEEAFRHMAREGDDVLESGADAVLSSWDEEEWEWS